MSYYDLNDMTSYIRRAATARGIDPEVALRVARSEGLARNTWQSNANNGSGREPSYGPFQLLVGGGNTGYPTGMGNDFQRSTGLDPSDPANAYATVDFALDGAARNGWGAWYGAANSGIGNREGLNGAKAIGLSLNSAPGMRSRPTFGPAGEDRVTPNLPALDPPVNVRNAPVADVGDTISPPVNDSFDFGGKFAGMDFKAPGVGKGLSAIANALGGGSGPSAQEQAHAQPIQSSLPAEAAADAQRVAAAQGLMSQIMEQRSRGGLRPRGLSLMG